jgi:hypothetical protein
VFVRLQSFLQRVSNMWICSSTALTYSGGMEQVICVSTAKVPIVKIWDPELCLACDMNVNNTLALENTRMVKTYVQIDPRVRPLAMIIKYWTKRRVLNDAGKHTINLFILQSSNTLQAFGGTLNSYTWICMIINFLQSRNSPILPSLHQRPHMKLPPKDGLESAFADDLDALGGFGQRNEESLGELLFEFFRFYGHEFDYDKLVVSVRNGKQISKFEKKWNLANNNRLCVEEPFNTTRNLGNTADDTSFRGLHMELRRAFDLVSKAKLEECCEQYHYPKEEERVWERPPQKPKPVIRSASQSGRGGRGGQRGGRHNNQHSRNSNNNRRASSGAFDNNPAYMPGVLPSNLSLPAHDTWLQQQAQAQLHNDLYATYSVLQAQENSLRLQLYTQSQAYLQAQNQVYAQSQGRSQGNSGTTTQHATDRNRTNSFDQPPLTAPIRPDMYFYPLHYQGTPIYGYQTPSTNPSSPSLSHAVPELRRSMHRSTITNGSGPGGMQSSSSLRSHSQPAARSAPSPMQGTGMVNSGLGIYQQMRQANRIPIPNFLADENSEPGFHSQAGSLSTTPPEDTAPKEYVGYYVNGPTPNPMRRESLMPMTIPTFGDIQQSRRRLSTDQLPQSILDRMKRQSRSPSPLGHDRSYSVGAHSAPITAVPSQQGISSTNLLALNTQGPLVVNGSNPTPVSIPHWQASVSEGSASEDLNSETAMGPLDSISQASGAGSDSFSDQELSGQRTPRDSRSEGRIEIPLVINGSAPQTNEPTAVSSSVPTNGVSPPLLSPPNGLMPGEQLNGPPRLSPNTRNRLTRQAQNGGMSPLDIGSNQNEGPRDDVPHLSPVYEARTPSPTANRKFEPVMDRKPNAVAISPKGEKPEGSKEAPKLSPANGNQIKQATTALKPNGHTRAAKSEGSLAGAWQKIPKSKKKGGQPHSEKPPNNQSERKGG